MSRDSGIEDDIYEESMMSHHDYDSTSIKDMTENNTHNGFACFEDPAHYTYDDSTCMEDMELYVDNGSSCMEPMEHYTDNGSTCLGDMEYYTNNYSPSMDDFECYIDDSSPSMEDTENFIDFDGSSMIHEEFLHRVEMEAYYAKQEEAHHQDSMTFKAKCATPKGTTYFDDPPPRRHVPPPRWRQAPPSPRHQAPSPPRRQAPPSPGAKLHHRQGAKLQLLSKHEWRPNIICIKRRQETRLFIDKHPLMSIATIKRIQDIVKGIFAIKTKNSR